MRSSEQLKIQHSKLTIHYWHSPEYKAFTNNAPCKGNCKIHLKSAILSSEKFSCQREQSQTCLSYTECSRKSHVCKMYEMLNKQVKILTSQYVGTFASAYTKGYALN